MTPLVTIAIPTYNRPEGLRRALKSLANQTYKNIEIVVGENPSEHPAVGIVAEFYSYFYNMDHYRHKTNIGMEANFNFLATQGHGKYFAFLADDDTWDADYIETAVCMMENYPDVISVAGSSLRTPPDYMAEKPRQRLWDFYSKAQHCSHFYTLKPRWLNKKLLPLSRAISCDSVYQGQCLLYGKMITVESSRQHISPDGASKTTDGHLKMRGRPAWHKYIIPLELLYHTARRVGLYAAVVMIVQPWWWREVLVVGGKRMICNVFLNRDTL
jgi:glycosyltransferase involved in cell wall biosynthesis